MVELVEPGFVAGIDGAPWGEDVPAVHPIEIVAGGIVVHDAIGLVRRQDSSLPAVAVGGDDLYVGRGRTVERRTLPFPPGAPVRSPVAGEPSSLLATAGGCFVGLAGRVDHVDFSTTPPRARTAHHDPALVKPVDFIVPAQRGLVAVDDEVMPKYAFVLRLDASRPARLDYTAELPSGPNESYGDVASVDGTLVISATYGVMDGSGNTLYRWPISRKSDGESGDAIGEHRPDFQPGLAPTLIAGRQLTYWNGLAVVDGHLFIGAGTRGVLHMPLEADRADLHDLGGWCLDLVALGGTIVALVAVAGEDGEPVLVDRLVSGRRQVVLLSWKDGSIAEISRHDVEPSLDGLVI
jgi:hypothetical protein